MSVIQGVSYPVSAVVQSQQQIPPRDTTGQNATKPSTAPASVSTDLAPVSSRVNAFLAIEQSASTNSTRPDQRSPDSSASETSANTDNAVKLDDAQIYQPSAKY